MTLPTFPKMRPLTLQDRQLFAALSRSESPSDHNFASLFSWNTAGRTMIAGLHGNAVISMQAYTSEHQIYTILGGNEAQHTVDHLLDYIAKLDPRTQVAMIPVEVAHQLDPARYDLLEDRANFDYLISLSDLARAEGRSFQQFRRVARSFNGEVDLSVVESDEPSFSFVVADLNRRWAAEKQKVGVEADFGHEAEAIRRCIAHARDIGAHCFKGMMGTEPVFYGIFGRMTEREAICHFIKANTWDHPGSMQVFLQAAAARMLSMGYDVCNFEQDLGLPGLRRFKTSLAPVRMIKKWTVTPNTG